MGGMLGGAGGGYMPQPYDGSKMQAAFEQQSAFTGKMMGDLLKQQQEAGMLAQQQQASSLAEKNKAQQQSISGALGAANQNFQQGGGLNPMQSQFKIPNTGGLTFGGI